MELVPSAYRTRALYLPLKKYLEAPWPGDQELAELIRVWDEIHEPGRQGRKSQQPQD